MQVFNVNFYCKFNFYCSLNIVHNNIGCIDQHYTCELNKVAYTYSIVRDYVRD